MRWLLVCIAALLLLVTACGGQTEPASSTATQAVSAPSEVPADYVVLLDISGSMAEFGRYASVLRALPRLFDGLAPVDRVSLYTFDSAVHSVYSGAGGLAPELVEKLPAAPTLDAVTDLGPAIGTALDELQRPDAPRIATVVLITDGVPDPPPESPYATLSAPAWDDLARRAHALDRPDAAIYAVLLGAGEFDDAQVDRIFGSAVVLRPGSVTEFGDGLGGAAARAADAKTRVAGESASGPAVVPDSTAGPGQRDSGGKLVPALVLLAIAAALSILVGLGLRTRRSKLSGTLVIKADTDARELLRLPLAGRRMSLAGPEFPGRGAVTPLRSHAVTPDIDVVAISYSRVDGVAPITGHCRAGESIILGGHIFSYYRKAE